MRSTSSVPIRTLTHNIRYATTSPFKGEETWDIRKSRLCNELIFNTRYSPEAFICLQEVLHNQLVDIDSALNRGSDKYPAWVSIGVGREDGKQAGEYSPIFYQPTTWKLEKSKNVWLSETPDRPSKSWDASSTRILTIGVFRHKESRMRIVAMNTHLDDQGSKSRYEAAKIILNEIEEACHQGNGRDRLPVFLAGDFNSEEHEEAYQRLNHPKSSIQDLRDKVRPTERYGDECTFTGFGYGPEPTKRIDFLFLERGIQDTDTGLSAVSYGVLANRFDDKVYLSDHRAVVGDLLLSRI
ncbi:MAG: hypothetical protein M1837_004984 [Sclerophora amabilis]|nr:MAG: hypothetical protein M1837_004984 [Sclerophora amabilis]